jgi:hypothetical protein
MSVAGEPIPLGEDAGPQAGWTGSPEHRCRTTRPRSFRGRAPNTNWPGSTGRGGRWGGSFWPRVYVQGQFARDGSTMVVMKGFTPGLDRSVAGGHEAYAGHALHVRQLRLTSCRDGRRTERLSHSRPRRRVARISSIKPANSASEEKRLFTSGVLFAKPEAWTPDAAQSCTTRSPPRREPICGCTTWATNRCRDD